MTASTLRRGISQIGDDAVPITARCPLAGSQVIKRGHHVAKNSSGYGVQFTALTTLTSFGIALEDADTTGLADGLVVIEVLQGTVDQDVGLSGDALANSDMPCACYAIDNHTVGKTDGSTSRSVAGLFLGLNEENAQAHVLVGPVGYALAKALLADTGGDVTQAQADMLGVLSGVHIRGIVDANVASLAAFAGVAGGSPVNGVTYVAGDVVLLVKQTTAAQNGPYLVGTVGGGVAALTRPGWWATAAAIPEGFTFEVGIEDTAYPGSSWKSLCVSGKVVDTDDPIFYPRIVKGVATLITGVKAVTTAAKVWLKSTTVSTILVTRNTANTTTATTGGYATPVSARTAGIIGTGSFEIRAQAADGTTNTADISTIDWVVTNW
jgi:hypothetical protein